MQIFIEPSDVLLFRDGRPFSAGEGHRAKSLFPPTPNTMQGVIRSKILADRCGRYEEFRNGCGSCSEQNNCTIPEEIGRPINNDKVNYGLLKLRGALIAKYQDKQLIPYFPIPADVVKTKVKSSSTESKYSCLQPLKQAIWGTNDLQEKSSSLLPLWTTETQPVEGVQGYWNHLNLENYLLENPFSPITSSQDLYQKEARFGIAIDNARQAASESKLYQIEYIRCLQDIGLYVEIEGIKYLSSDAEAKSGLMAIGGENRAASYDQVAGINWENFKENLKIKLEQANGFKLYLATPTIFRGGHTENTQTGWIPKWINHQDFTGEYQGVQVKLVAAAISRYQTIGGWDIARNRQKPTRRAVGAGSLYYFTTQAKPEDIIKTFHWQNLADDVSEGQIGFGLSLIGCWNYCNLG